MRDFTSDLRDVERRLGEAETYLSVSDNRERFAVLEAEISDPALWDDQERAKKLNTEYANIRDDLAVFDQLTEQFGDVEVLHELARDEDDESQEPDIESAIASVNATLDRLELRSLFTGEHDDSDCIMQINAKDGGVDAQDFAEMLLRMYERWCELRGFTITLNYVSEGAEAGIMSAEVTISGRYAYGLMTANAGRTGSSGSVPSTTRDGARRRSQRCRCGRCSTTSTSTSTTPTSAWRSSGPPVPAASTSTRRRRPFV